MRNINLIYPPVCLCWYQPMNKCKILVIAEELVHLLDKCVSMGINISLKAIKTPLTKRYLTL